MMWEAILWTSTPTYSMVHRLPLAFASGSAVHKRFHRALIGLKIHGAGNGI